MVREANRVVLGLRLRDTVGYALPFGPLGTLVRRLIVRAALTRIFDFRATTVARLFARSNSARAVAAPGGGAVESSGTRR